MLKKKKILTLLLFSVISYAESAHIEVDISEQRLYLIENSLIKASYPISTSKYGEGSIENSFKTFKSHFEKKNRHLKNIL